MQISRILVGTDFSASSTNAVRWIAEHFAGGVEIILAHVVNPVEPPRFLRGRYPQREVLIDLASRGARDRLDDLALSLESVASPFRCEVLVGRPAEQLADFARSHAADLVVVGRHGAGAGAVPRGRIGSTADQLLRQSPVPVVLAAGFHDAPPRRILVALDDAEVSTLCARWARHLADRFGAHVEAIHVIPAAVLTHVLSMEAVTTGQAMTEDRVRDEFKEDADRWLLRLTGEGLDPRRVSSAVAFGEPGQEIVAAASRGHVDLVIVGRRGRGDIRRALLGSVAREVLSDAPCPVFVVVEADEKDRA